MALIVADRVQETSTTTGTGSLTLGGAVTGFQAFSSVLSTGDTTYYTIADQGGANWEVGLGTFTSPSTLARTTILSSSNAGSAVNFTAGSKAVFITYPAGRSVLSNSSGVVPVAAGGTGAATLTANNVLLGNGTSAVQFVAPGTSGNVLTSNGTTWSSSTASPTYGYRRNRIINGSMVIDQRNAGATGTASVYTVDRWAYNANQASKGTWGQNLNSVTTLVGFPNYLGFQSSSAYTLLAGDGFTFIQGIEGFNFADLGFGTASAQAVTISFVVYSSLTGTFGGTLQNFAQTRSYPFTYSIPTANTWTSISVTIPGDTSGTWVGSTSAGAAYLQLAFGVGSTKSGTAGAWASTNYISATGAVSVVGTNGATFYVTGVQLEPGSIATPFERLPYGETLALCQRYYYSNAGNDLFFSAVGILTPTAACQLVWFFKQEMRVAPTIGGSYSFIAFQTTSYTNTTSTRIQGNATDAGSTARLSSGTVSAEL
jgi:hypothetical protein